MLCRHAEHEDCFAFGCFVLAALQQIAPGPVDTALSTNPLSTDCRVMARRRGWLCFRILNRRGLYRYHIPFRCPIAVSKFWRQGWISEDIFICGFTCKLFSSESNIRHCHPSVESMFDESPENPHVARRYFSEFQIHSVFGQHTVSRSSAIAHTLL